jgi:hypothetical protein
MHYAKQIYADPEELQHLITEGSITVDDTVIDRMGSVIMSPS